MSALQKNIAFLTLWRVKYQGFGKAWWSKEAYWNRPARPQPRPLPADCPSWLKCNHCGQRLSYPRRLCLPSYLGDHHCVLMAACTRTGVSKSKSWDMTVDGGFKKDAVHAEGPPGPGWIPHRAGFLRVTYIVECVRFSHCKGSDHRHVGFNCVSTTSGTTESSFLIFSLLLPQFPKWGWPRVSEKAIVRRSEVIGVLWGTSCLH